MRTKEKAETITRIKDKIRKRGMPINIQTGSNKDAAEWFGKLLEELLLEDEPLGVVDKDDYTACPECGSAVGISAYWCKKCGAYLRYKPER